MTLRPTASRPDASGFTLAEIMIAMAIFVIVIGGIMTAHLFGLRMLQVNKTTLTATAWSRSVFGKIADEVRSSNTVLVGNLNTTNNTFEGLLDGEPQQGNALMIFPTTDTNSYILYFLNVNGTNQPFQRTTDQTGSAKILAYQVTNTVIFTAQDYFGNVLTSSANSNNPVIHLTLDFYQPPAFQQNAYAYKLETSMTHRASPSATP